MKSANFLFCFCFILYKEKMLIDKQQLKVEIEDGREVKSLVKIKTTLSSLSILRYRFKGFPYLESHSV